MAWIGMRGVLAVALIGVMALPPAVEAADYPAEMQFEIYQPCQGSASFCAPRILARGEIDEGASERLNDVLEALPFRTTISFDSPGGSLKEGVAIGLLIRGGGHDTLVANEYSEESSSSRFSGYRVLAEGAGCYSACAYAFMGGVSRTLGEGGRIGVHQFAGTVDDSGEAAAQAMTAILSQYVAAMGVDRDVLDLAGLTQAGEMSIVSQEDAIKYNLDNQHPVLASWSIQALDTGDIVAMVDQQQSGSDRVTRVLIGRAGDGREVLYVAIASTLPIGTKSELVQSALKELDAPGEFCIDYGACIPAIVMKRWRYVEDEGLIKAIFAVDANALVSFASGEGRLTWNSNFPEVHASLRPDVELGRGGLRNALLALLR